MKLNDELEMSCPDGFHIMDENERKGLRMARGGECVLFSDPERHMIVSVGWRKSGLFAGFLPDTGGIAVKAEKSMIGSMKRFGCTKESDSERQLDGETAKGFRYRYTAQDIEMCGETYALKRRKTVYYFHLYTRAALKDENQAVWSEMLNSVHWLQ